MNDIDAGVTVGGFASCATTAAQQKMSAETNAVEEYILKGIF